MSDAASATRLPASPVSGPASETSQDSEPSGTGRPQTAVLSSPSDMVTTPVELND
jgi:hypothetical protein